MRFAIFLSTALVFCTVAKAEQGYVKWANPNQPAAVINQPDRAQEIVDRLNALIKEAEQARAADPNFLGDLRDLARGFDRPWRNRVLFEDFLDGDYTSNPKWNVSTGRFWIEGRWGLRSALQTPSRQRQNEPRKKLTGEDVARALFGKVLDQALGESNGDQGGSARTVNTLNGHTEIHSDVSITNAFAIEITFSSWLKSGKFEFGPYDGSRRSRGYRLAYLPKGELKLLSVSDFGSRVIYSAKTPKLEDKKSHVINWTRRDDGAMVVTLDDKELINVADREHRAPFSGFTMSTQSGDFITKSISIMATN